MKEYGKSMSKCSKAVVSFYNIMYNQDVSTVHEIPCDILQKLTLYYNYRELMRPFVVQQIKKGLSTRYIAIQTGLTPAEVRGIGRIINAMS